LSHDALIPAAHGLPFYKRSLRLFRIGATMLRIPPAARRSLPEVSNILGWAAVVLVTFAACVWSFWGTIEAFHEGWWQPRLSMRLLQLLAYLSPTIVFCGLAFAGIRWPRAGAATFALVGIVIAALIVIDRAAFSLDILLCITALPILLGLLFLLGRPKPLVAAYTVALGLPLLVSIICGVEPAYRVSTRFDDGDRGARLVQGNGVVLLWAPAGPGWSRNGNVTWKEAQNRIRFLTADGKSLADEPQEIWRLPTREEVVRSLTRHNRNAGGVWDAARQRATYDIKPDKESPLWDPFASLIYLWTSEEVDQQRVWIVVYHGGVHSHPKNLGSSSHGFRAVREMPEGASAQSTISP
jgi:hypothetical protein